MFNAEKPSIKYSPLVFSSTKSIVQHNNDGLHTVDPDITGILSALQYCLHLPRNGLETMDLPISTIMKAYSAAHNILLLPSYVTSQEAKRNNFPTPTLIICDEASIESARSFAVGCGSSLGFVSILELSTNLLKVHWGMLIQLMQKSSLKKSAPIKVNPRLLTASERKVLVPLSFLLNQFNMTEGAERELKKFKYIDKHRLEITIKIRSLINTLYSFEQKGKKEEDITKKELIKTRTYYEKNLKIPVVITLPGTSALLQPRGARDRSPVLGDIEKKFIEILGLHRSAARSAFWLDSNPLSVSMFDELRQLEHHFKEPSIKKVSNKYLLDTMKRLGRNLSDHLGNVGMHALSRASEITAYTDFPIGLAILPGQEDPLCCTTPISYNPLTPLTRTLQMKLPNYREKYIGLGRGFKVVIAECILPDDRIYKLSVEAWKKIREQLTGHENIEIVYSEIHSITSLKSLLAEHTDADILVISAHGSYDEDIAGLCVGDKVWLAADDDIQVPPIVILSACHVAPRGVGAVTVNDLFLRAGARAVLGTLIPVDVRKNAILTGRFFSYLIDAATNGGQFRTLTEAWQWVISSNAIYEIMESSTRLKEWAITRKDGKPSPLEEFKRKKSTGRLRNGFVYSDTVKVLQELAIPDGIDVEAIVSSQGYFPESCFYTWSGSPEEIILKEEVFEVGIKKGILHGRR